MKNKKYKGKLLVILGIFLLIVGIFFLMYFNLKNNKQKERSSNLEQKINLVLPIYENAIDSYSYVNDMQDMEEEVSEPIKSHNIVFKDVSFSYDDRLILKNVSAEIKENTMTAIVGPSGSGNTTFCNLIARFWDVNSGEILIGGKNIKDYKIENLMNSISMVFKMYIYLKIQLKTT